MHLFELTAKDTRLDMELCRAMFEKDPDRMIELVSEWLETHQLTTSDDFCVPVYLEQVLSGSDDCSADRPDWRYPLS